MIVRYNNKSMTIFPKNHAVEQKMQKYIDKGHGLVYHLRYRLVCIFSITAKEVFMNQIISQSAMICDVDN